MKRLQLPEITMPPKDAVITERSQVSFSIVLAVILGALGTIGIGAGAVWWASNVSARLSSIEGYMSTQNNKVVLIDQIDARLKMLETYGAPSSKAAIDQLAKELADMQRSMELQAARNGAGGAGK